MIEYIRNLPPAFQRFRKQGNLKVGSVVLIREGQRRMEWAMGVVEKLHKSQDGVSRSADLHTNRGLRRLLGLFRGCIIFRDVRWTGPRGFYRR